MKSMANINREWVKINNKEQGQHHNGSNGQNKADDTTIYPSRRERLLIEYRVFNVFGVTNRYMASGFRVSFKRLGCPKFIKYFKCANGNRTREPRVVSQKRYQLCHRGD